jgi:asparagine synthase (glutamine-hydrolysing)
MCGIAGLYCHHSKCNSESHLDIVHQMCLDQNYRGPDDTGFVSIGNVCLGSVRLSILDLSDAGHMPMSNEREKLWITYNGEIYNYWELRQELLAKGYSFKSRTDTEVLLNAYQEWEEDCLNRLIGMFAFAIYDKSKNKLVLVRDRVGIKPLYYYKTRTHLYFSSEIKVLVKLIDQIKIDKKRLIEWHLYRNIDVLSDRTLIDNIHTVLPGQIVTIKGEDIISKYYYRPSHKVDRRIILQNEKLKEEEIIQDVERCLQESIHSRMVSDVPLGTLCSGGIDSSLITAIASKKSKNISAFHISIEGYPQLDEKRFAESLCKNLKIPLISIPFTSRVFRENLTQTTYLSDMPLTHPNSVAFYQICKIARSNGVIVLLSGEGADELFGGYSWRYRTYRNISKLQKILKLLPRKIRTGIEIAGYASNDMPINSFLFDKLIGPTIDFIDGHARNELYEISRQAYSFVQNQTDQKILGAMLGDLNDFLTPLLRRLDRMSMGASVECRVPYLDHRLIEKVINLPLKYRINGRVDKYLLRSIAKKHLPRKLVKRKKFGFPLPLQDYLEPFAKKELFNSGFCSETLEISNTGILNIVNNWSKNVHAFFNLVALEIWGRIFVGRDSVDSVNEFLNKIENS